MPSAPVGIGGHSEAVDSPAATIISTLMADDTRPVVFNAATNTLVDFLRPSETPAEALVRLAEYGTCLTILPFEQAWQRHEAAAKTEPLEITSAHWHDMLGVLPPVAWKNDHHGESFKLSERTTGSITAIYVQIDGRYFVFGDSIFTPHAACCQRVRNSPAFDGPSVSSLSDFGRETVFSPCLLRVKTESCQRASACKRRQL